MYNVLPIDPPLSYNSLTNISSSSQPKWTLDRNETIDLKDVPPCLFFSPEIILNLPISWKQDEELNLIHALAKQYLVYHISPIANYKLCTVLGNAESLELIELRG